MNRMMGLRAGPLAGLMNSTAIHLGFASRPDGFGGGGDNTGDDGGNSGQEQGVQGLDSNNDGDAFDPTTFWDEPTPTPTPAPSGESAGGGNQGEGAGSQNGFASQLTTQLDSLTFGDPVFTAEVAEQINQGDFTGVEKRIQTQLRTAVRQAMGLNVQVLRPFAEQLMAQMRDEFGSTLTNRDNQDTLVKDFPAARNPEVAPVIRSVFDQALKKTGGDRTKAVTMTKRMIQTLTNATAEDLDLEVAPRGAGDSRPQRNAINWLDELSGRG